jgi:hypothetical protein
MLKQFREAAGRFAEQEAVYVTSETSDLELVNNVNAAKLVEKFKQAGIEHHEVEYDGGFYKKTYIYINPAIPKQEFDWYLLGQDAINAEQVDKVIFEYVKNRAKHIVWIATWLKRNSNSIVASSRRYTFAWSTRPGVDGEEIISLQDVITEIKAIADIKLSKEELRRARLHYDDIMESLRNQRNRLIRQNSEKKGLEAYLSKKPKVSVNASEYEEQIETAFAAMPGNAITSRTWGFELEIADAKGVEPTFNIDKGEDGSLRSYEASSDCECDCSDCTYHSCDCDMCDSQNEDPDHCDGRDCSSADMAEFRSKNGISRLKHAGLHKLCEALEAENAEVNDTCGVHIHVYGADLSTAAIAQLLATYKWIENIVYPIAGREDVNYAKHIPVDRIKTALKGTISYNKPEAVNVTNIVASSRGTIEFRQMEGNYDFKRITVWAWLVRGLVEVANRGAKFSNFKDVTDLNGIIEVLGKFNYFLHDEGAQMLIPGGINDNRHITTVTHQLTRGY